jgi:hypothetical protein
MEVSLDEQFSSRQGRTVFPDGVVQDATGEFSRRRRGVLLRRAQSHLDE